MPTTCTFCSLVRPEAGDSKSRDAPCWEGPGTCKARDERFRVPLGRTCLATRLYPAADLPVSQNLAGQDLRQQLNGEPPFSLNLVTCIMLAIRAAHVLCKDAYRRSCCP